MFNENWPLICKIIFKICFYIFTTFAYYLGNVIESYYVYVLLNNYFQLRVMMMFLRRAMAQKGLKQDSVREILKRTIQEFQRLKL